MDTNHISTTDKLLGLDEVAHRLGISRRAVEKLIAAGRLPSVHVGRRHLVAESALATFIETLSTSA